MPQQHGEVSLLTLYADVHYYFSHPSAKPPHHRFEKGSYVYLYHNPSQRRARVEVANCAGTPDQDAFMGFLDSVTVNRTFKQPGLITITVDPSFSGSAHSTPHQDYTQWHLPAADQRNEGKYMFKIHTLDIYLWTESDATLFSDTLQKCLQPHQVRLLDAPTPKTRHSEHSDTMSPVVQRLENLAVTKGYHQPRSTSVSTTQSFAGPPTTASSHHMSLETLQDSEPAGAPIAPYNPAAPAAPEPIAHREKTPPPPDAESGTGLVQAAAHEHGAQYVAPQMYQQHPSQSQEHQRQSSIPQTNATGSFPPPPAQSATGASHYGMSFAPPPTQAATPYAQTTSPQSDIQRHPSSHTSYSGYSTQSSQPTSPSQYPSYTTTPGYPPAPGHSQGGHPTRVQSPGVTIQGYSNYSYQQNQVPHDPYAIHSQAYRPTELEAHSRGSKHKHAPVTDAQAGPGVPGPGKFENGMNRMEKGVNRFFKKLDKTL
ncbi:hypothetical protein IWZ00DRAFT_210701 [Phyllosticta capitalensis]|uniref:RNA recognition motif-containing protein n=1 Tax=Phyllosticta capitalensis TaxID=121624 RepID=A0ABR1YT75_9PEZI